jgi:hypothetical protein
MSRVTTKSPIRKEQSCKRRKDRQHNVQRKTSNGQTMIHKSLQKTNNESAIGTLPNTEVEAAVIPDG